MDDILSKPMKPETLQQLVESNKRETNAIQRLPGAIGRPGSIISAMPNHTHGVQYHPTTMPLP